MPAGHSYVAEVWTLEYAFAPLRVDVTRIGGDGGEKKVEVWQTFRGHEWGNKGEKLGDGNGGVRVKVQVLGERRFYEERKGCECARSTADEGTTEPEERDLNSADEWMACSLAHDPAAEPDDLDGPGGHGGAGRHAQALGKQ